MTAKLADALCKAQSIMTGAKKTGLNPHFKSQYATLDSVFDAIREPFSSNGLSVTQLMETTESGRTVLVTLLLHVSGEKLESRMMLPDLKRPQEVGSALTYYRRYSLMAIAGIPAEDDDGNAANRGVSTQPSKDSPIGKEKAEILEIGLRNNDSLRAEVDQYLKNNNLTLDRIPASVAASIREAMDAAAAF